MGLKTLAREGLTCQIDMPSARMVHSEKAAHRLLCRPVYASKADAMCKDLVNAPRKTEAAQEGVTYVSFLGAGGKEITVECPKVSKAHFRDTSGIVYKPSYSASNHCASHDILALLLASYLLRRSALSQKMVCNINDVFRTHTFLMLA